MLSVFIKNCKSKTLISWRCFNSLSFIRCCSYSSHWGAKTNILDINCLSVNVTSIHMNYDISFSLWVCLWKKNVRVKHFSLDCVLIPYHSVLQLFLIYRVNVTSIAEWYLFYISLTLTFTNTLTNFSLLMSRYRTPIVYNASVVGFPRQDENCLISLLLFFDRV